MAKIFKYYDTYDHFKVDKVSDSEDNTSYYDWDLGLSVSGTPNVKFNIICFIADKGIIYTHGQKYTSAESVGITEEDVKKLINEHKKSNPKGMISGINQYCIYNQDNVILQNYVVTKNDDDEYKNVYTYNTYFLRATDQPTYVRQYGRSYTDSDGNVLSYYTYYPNGMAGLMAVRDVQCMWQSWHAVNNIPDQLVGYLGTSYATSTTAYISSYSKSEDGTEYPTISTSVKKKEYGNWKCTYIPLPTVTTSSAGVMTGNDKIKLDSIEVQSDYHVDSVETAITGTTMLRENYEPNGENFVNIFYIDFRKGDKIMVEIDLTPCSLEEDNILSIGSDISIYGKTSSGGLDQYKGNFHFYHNLSDTTETLQIDYADSKTIIHEDPMDISSSKIVTVEVGIEDGTPYFKVNGNTLSKVSTYYLTTWTTQTVLQIGCNTESTKTPHVKYNYIKIVSGNASSDVAGVEVNYLYGNAKRSFVIPNATTDTNGVMSRNDKALLETLSTLQSEGGVIGGTVDSSSYTYIGGTASYTYYKINDDSSLITKSKKNGTDMLITTSDGTNVSEIYNQVKGNLSLIGVNQYKNNFAAVMEASYTVGLVQATYTSSDSTYSTASILQCNTNMSIFSTSYISGSNSYGIEMMSTESGNTIDLKKDGKTTVSITDSGITINGEDVMTIINNLNNTIADLQTRIIALESK